MKKVSPAQKLMATFVAFIVFYFFGIMFNSACLRMFFDIDLTAVPAWSGEGFLFTAIAALVGVLCRGVYKLYIKED